MGRLNSDSGKSDLRRRQGAGEDWIKEGETMRRVPWRQYLIYILVTAITLFTSRHLMILIHEWTHSSVAWILGQKERPFDIHYGDWTLLNVDEKVDYEMLFSIGKGQTASIIAVSALVANLGVFLLCTRLLSREAIQQHKWIYQLIFWFAVSNIGELFSYVPIRTFVGDRGDVGHFVVGLGISPWIAFLIGSFIVSTGLWYLFTRELPNFYQVMSISTRVPQRIYMGLVIFVIFFWYGASAFHDYGAGDMRSLWSLFSAMMGVILFAVYRG